MNSAKDAITAARIRREAKTIKLMIEFFCSHKHAAEGASLCDSCSEILDYSLRRLESCPFGPRKPVCSACQVHCYRTKSDLREGVCEVMRYSGPRMLLRHPLLALWHQLDRVIYRCEKKKMVERKENKV